MVRNNLVVVIFEKPYPYAHGTCSMNTRTMKYIPDRLIGIFLKDPDLTPNLLVFLCLQHKLLREPALGRLTSQSRHAPNP